jgi:hypothetical protein
VGVAEVVKVKAEVEAEAEAEVAVVVAGVVEVAAGVAAGVVAAAAAAAVGVALRGRRPRHSQECQDTKRAYRLQPARPRSEVVLLLPVVRELCPCWLSP